MSYYWHNIGTPVYPATWATLWQRLREHGVVTAGFGNLPDGRGRDVVCRYAPGDFVLAYANGAGLLGYAVAQGPDTAELRDGARNGSDHRHEARVDWQSVLELDQAIPPVDLLQRFGIRHPRQTSQKIDDEQGAELTRAVDGLADRDS